MEVLQALFRSSWVGEKSVIVWMFVALLAALSAISLPLSLCGLVSTGGVYLSLFLGGLVVVLGCGELGCLRRWASFVVGFVGLFCYLCISLMVFLVGFSL